MSLWSKLFGGKSGDAAGAKPKANMHEHKGFQIEVAPMKESGGYRVAATISKDVEGEAKTHQMIRADTIASLEEAEEVTLHKAKQFIDQMGDGIFR